MNAITTADLPSEAAINLRPLLGQTALVTGSTRGIGLGIAQALARAGCDVALHGQGLTTEGRQLAETLAGNAGVRSVHVAADLRHAAELTPMLRQVTDRLGPVTILVNNAGIQHVAPVADFTDEAWDDVIALNLTAAFRATRAVLPGMAARQWGRIVNIASVHGLVASERKCAYVAAKHGLLGLTKTVALETARDGITCNAICPGWVETDLVRTQVAANAARDGVGYERARDDLLRAKQPLARFTTPAGIGALVLFLCSEEAATMTGAAVAMDGGWVAT